MSMLWDAFWARVGWALGELALFAGVLLLILAGIIVRAALVAWKQYRCKHTRIRPAGVADTEQRCVECNKFICYTWDLQKLKQETKP